MPELVPALYTGTLRHRRFRPRPHHFRYSLFMAFLDIDRLPELMRVSPFAGYNRWNWASFHDSDHLGDPELPLRRRLESEAIAQGVTLPGGRIFLLTHLRYLGYCFNPVSFYYCLDESGEIRAVLAEVNNTFGESRSYWLTQPDEDGTGHATRYRHRKLLHVSPFMAMDLEYKFAFTRPADSLSVHMETIEGRDATFDATLTLRREPWDRRSLHRALAAHPWMTAKVIGAIHWEALRLYLKGLRVYAHPASLRESQTGTVRKEN